jgi:3-isopropylmalate dehydrogenase
MRATVQLLPGDGVGPEVTREAARVLAAVAARFGHRFDFAEAPVGGAGIDAGGGPLPDATLAACRAADAVFLGAVGGPRWEGGPGPRPEQGLLALRRALDVYANLRPVRVPDAAVPHSALRPERVQGVDLLFVRELTGGLYFGPRHRRALAAREEEAVDTCRYATAEIARVARRAGALARGRRGIVTPVDKAKVLETSTSSPI